MEVELGPDPTINGGALNGKAAKVARSQGGTMPPPSDESREILSWLGQAIVLDDRHPDGRKVRSDALPECLEYRDRGCDLAPSCLRCPLVRCRYDEPGGARRLLKEPRDEAVCHRRGEGAGIDALALEFSLSRRSVFRILARGRENGAGKCLI